MSFYDGNKRSGENEPEDEDFYELRHGKKEDDDSMNDFLKNEDFELEGYEEKEEESEESGESEGLRSKRIKQRRRRRNTIFKIVAILLVLILAAVAVVFWLVPWIKGRFFTESEIPEEERITVPESLILGDDVNIVFSCAGENLLEPEISSIILSSYYTSGNKLISLCIPPRTLMDIPGFGAETVGNSVNIGGMDLLDLSLENNLGMDIEVDYHILFDVYNTVNKLGGIDIELDEEVLVKNYDDGSTFKMEKGSNLLDGAETLNFLKYFSGIEKDVPVENIVKQKLVIDAIIKKIVGTNEEEFSSNLNSIEDFIDTNSSMEDRLKIFAVLSNLEPANNNVYNLDVTPSEDPGVEDVIYIPQNISKLAEIFSKDEIPEEEETDDFTSTIKITILNGAYDSPEAFGLAGNTSESLKGLKFEDGTNKYEIVEVGNSQDIYDSTQILIYSPDTNKLAAADDVREFIGTGAINIREDEISNSDIILILGKDYLALLNEPAQVEEEESLAKIIVLNGEGTTKLAATVTDIIDDYLNSGGERVIMMEPKDADNHDYTQTRITIFSSGEGISELAQSIQERLGVGVIEYSENNVDNVDISIIVGSDYTNQ